MRIHFIVPPNNFLEKLIPELEKLGCEITDKNPDFIIGMSISQMEKIREAHKKFPKVPMINYNWDIYEWVWKHPRGKEHDYKGYGKLLADSVEVWCPSECTVKRMKEWFNLDNGKVLLTYSPFYDEKIEDHRYVFNPLREIPDRNLGWFEKACKELGIPYKNKSKGNREWKEYKKVVARCSFIVSPYYEASTGGLTLIEGTYLGKPCLISDSPYCGARDYLGRRAWYFKHDDYEDLKKQIKMLWEDTPRIEINNCQNFVKINYTAERMAKDIYKRLKKL